MASSKRKRRFVFKELICNKCETKLDPNQLYCYECGEPTAVLREDLSAFKTIKEVWEAYKENKGIHYVFATFYFFALLVPLGFIIAYTRSDYYLHNLYLLFFLPFLFIPFSMGDENIKTPLTINAYYSSLKHYPKYFLFSLLNILYFYLLKLITTSVDPILNLVRLVMVLYWLAIVVPLPVLIAQKKVNILKGWLLVYRGGKETRWQQFFIYLFAAIINLIGLALIGLGLLVTVPFSIAVIKAYYRKMDTKMLFGEAVSAQEQPI